MQKKWNDMSSTNLITAAQVYFPNLTIKYKNQSLLMKIFGKLLFFNTTFMTEYITTLGNTVYLPDDQYVINNPQAFVDVFIHECVHMYDEKRVGFWYQLAYAFPQLLSIICFLMIFLVSWKIMVPMGLLLLAPLPAPWRTYFEKRAYFVQMYVAYSLWADDPTNDVELYSSWFRDSNYYFMWPFESSSSFGEEAANIKTGNPSCLGEPALHTMVNALITAAKS